MNRTMRFSARAIEALPAPPSDWPSSNIEYTDAAESGLRIAVYKSGRRSYRHRYTFRGVKMMMTLGESPSVSVERARERVRANKALLAEDLDPGEEREKLRQAPTFAEFVERSFLPFARKERRSIKDIENRIKRLLLPVFGHKQINMISKRDIAELHIRLRDEVSGITANRTLALISGMFSRAIEWGYLSENPVRGIKKFRENGPRKRVLASEELRRFLTALRNEGDTPSALAILLLLATGLRKMEVLSMQWSYVDLERKSVYLPQTKSGKPRYAVLNRQALEVLSLLKEQQRSSSPFVFPSQSARGHLLEVRRTLEAVMAEAGIENLRLHDLRRSFASLLVNAGVSIYQVKDLLGHADVRTTQGYAHLGTQALQAASETAADEMGKVFA